MQKLIKVNKSNLENMIVNEYKDINLKGDLTASGNVSASGYVSCSALVIAGSEIRGAGGDITASGDIKAAGFDGPLTTTGITSTGPGIFTTLDTGQGATEVYLMNQNVRTSDAVTFATINTGLGATEVYPMDQSVASTANVTFASFRLSKVAQSAGNFGEVITITDGLQSFTITVNNIPEIPGKNADVGGTFKTTINQIDNDAIRADSVILITSTKDLSATAFRVSNGQCFFSIANESDTAFSDGSAQFNFTIF